MANFNINKVILGGRLTADVELKSTQSGVSVCQFNLAVNRRFSKEGEQAVDFITCVAWRATAEFISRYFHKGSSLCIVGNIQTRTWTDPQTNQKRYATEVIVDEVMFVDSKSDNASASGNAGSQGYMPDAYANGAADYSDDDDVPF